MKCPQGGLFLILIEGTSRFRLILNRVELYVFMFGTGGKSAQNAFLKSILSKEGKFWSDFYKYVKRRK